MIVSIIVTSADTKGHENVSRLNANLQSSMILSTIFKEIIYFKIWSHITTI